MRMFDYETKTSFWTDFQIAESLGMKAVEDTFNRAFEEWKSDVVYITELTMVMNWRLWATHQSAPQMAKLYQKLWETADAWCMENLKGDDLSYFLRTTD